MVTPELIKADENLSVELWDSDRHSADDIVGKVELSMQKMIQHPGKMYPQVSKLSGMDEGSEMPGELHWEVGFFGKPKFRPALRTDGKNKALPGNLKDHPELQDEKGTANNATDDAVQHTPPDPLWPSGICSIVVHQIVNLELENVKGTVGSRKGREFEPAKPYGEDAAEEGDHLPTSYCTILFNDELVSVTRFSSLAKTDGFRFRYIALVPRLSAASRSSTLVLSALFGIGALPLLQSPYVTNVTANMIRSLVLYP